MKVLVTGAGGFIGRAFVPILLLAGHQVVATSRNPHTLIDGVTVLPIGELGPTTDWTAALVGVDAVIHLAARVHIMSDTASDPMAENRRINCDGTRYLAQQAADANVQHFIFLSTIKVNGETTGTTPFRSDDFPAPVDPYAIAKYEAEQALMEIAENSEMRLSIIRPPLVYGPGVRGNFLSLLHLSIKEWPMPFGALVNRRSLVFVENLADLISHLLTRPGTPGGVYLCRDDDDVSTPELFKRVSQALGKKARVFPFPLFLLRLAGLLTGKQAAISRLSENLVVDDQPTRDDLDWTPPFSMVQGLQETADWFKNKR